MKHRVLIIVDVQKDLCSGGPLEITDSDSIVPGINAIIPMFDRVVAAQVWHPPNHKSFFSNHPNAKPFDHLNINGYNQLLWPVHCVAGTPGAEFHPDLDMRGVHYIFRKGYNEEYDSYSAFFDNCRVESTLLSNLFVPVEQYDIYVCGITLDFCVSATARDAKALGYDTFVIEDLCRSLYSPEVAIGKLKADGITIIKSNQIK